MKGTQIKYHMENGTLFVKYKDVICEVLHKFKYTCWINFKGNLYTVQQKDLEYHRLEKGPSTYQVIKIGNKQLRTKLFNEYIEKININWKIQIFFIY